MQFNFLTSINDVYFQKPMLNVMNFSPAAEEDDPEWVEGYTDKYSYIPGERVGLAVHSAKGEKASLRVIRYGSPDRDVAPARVVSAPHRRIPFMNHKTGFKWSFDESFLIDKSWKSGMYEARLCVAERCFSAPFIVKSLSPEPLAVVASTNTWEAYNQAGGSSLYHRSKFAQCLGHPLENFVHAQRPKRTVYHANHLLHVELPLYRWLDREHISYSLYSDADLHDDPTVFMKHEAIALNGHSEYWTDTAYRRMSDYVAGGGKLLSLAGNVIYARVAYKDNLIELRTNGQMDSITNLVGGHWRYLEQNEARLLGSGYTSAGASTYSPYRVLKPEHWVFQGTQLNIVELFGRDPAGKGGASGEETDKLNPAFPPNNTEVSLAEGTNPKLTEASPYYLLSSSPMGGPFSAVGSIAFRDSALDYDGRVGIFVKNAIHHFTRSRPEGGNLTGKRLSSLRRHQNTHVD